MIQTTTGTSRRINSSSDLEYITIGLKKLAALLQIYDEHREEELAGVDPQKPYTVAVLVNRQELGLALLRAIEDKVNSLQEFAASSTKRTCELAQGEKSSATEREG